MSELSKRAIVLLTRHFLYPCHSHPFPLNSPQQHHVNFKPLNPPNPTVLLSNHKLNINIMMITIVMTVVDSINAMSRQGRSHAQVAHVGRSLDLTG